MSAPHSTVSGLCFRCGGDVTAAQPACSYCGMPVLPEMMKTAPPYQPVAMAFEPVGHLPPVTGAGDRRRGLIALAVVGALILIIGAVAGVARLLEPSPEGVVEDYFAALSDGDAAAALRVLGATEERYPLLTDAALPEQHRPTQVEIGEVRELAAPVEVHRVDVRYQAGGRPVAQTIDVIQTGDGPRLSGPLVELIVTGGRGREISVNGVRLGADEVQTVAFPGAYEITAAGNALLAEATRTAVPTRSVRGGAAAGVEFGPPELAAGALPAIQSQVRSILDRCAASTDSSPAGCPFGLTVPGTDATVRWSITTYPSVTAQGGTVVSVGDDGTGRAHWEIDYTTWAGEARRESGDSSFSVRGRAELAGSDIHVTLD